MRHLLRPATLLLALSCHVSSRALPSEHTEVCTNTDCTVTANITDISEHAQLVQRAPVVTWHREQERWTDRFSSLFKRAKSPSSSSSGSSSSSSSSNGDVSANPLQPDLPPQASGQPGSPMIIPLPGQPSQYVASNPGAPMIIPEPTSPKANPSQDEGPAATSNIQPSASAPSPTAATPEVSPSSDTGNAPSNGDAQPFPVCKRSSHPLLARAGDICTPADSGDQDTTQSGFRADPPSARSFQPTDNWYEAVEGNPDLREPPSMTAFRQRVANPDQPDTMPAPLKTNYDDSTKEDMPDGSLFQEDIGLTRNKVESVFNKVDPSIGESDRGIVNTYLASKQPNQVGGYMQINGFAKDGRAIIADSSKAAADGTPAGPGKLRWNQLIFQQFAKEMERHNGNNLTKLQYFGRSQVKNEATKRTLHEAVRRVHRQDMTKLDPNKVFVFRGDAKANSEEDKAFRALSWSDNVNGVWWLLQEFYQSLGRKKIVAIHGRLDDKEADLVLELGPA